MERYTYKGKVKDPRYMQNKKDSRISLQVNPISSMEGRLFLTFGFAPPKHFRDYAPDRYLIVRLASSMHNVKCKKKEWVQWAFKLQNIPFKMHLKTTLSFYIKVI